MNHPNPHLQNHNPSSSPNFLFKSTITANLFDLFPFPALPIYAFQQRTPQWLCLVCQLTIVMKYVLCSWDLFPFAVSACNQWPLVPLFPAWSLHHPGCQLFLLPVFVILIYLTYLLASLGNLAAILRFILFFSSRRWSHSSYNLPPNYPRLKRWLPLAASRSVLLPLSSTGTYVFLSSPFIQSLSQSHTRILWKALCPGCANLYARCLKYVRIISWRWDPSSMVWGKSSTGNNRQLLPTACCRDCYMTLLLVTKAVLSLLGFFVIYKSSRNRAVTISAEEFKNRLLFSLSHTVITCPATEICAFF